MNVIQLSQDVTKFWVNVLTGNQRTQRKCMWILGELAKSYAVSNPNSTHCSLAKINIFHNTFKMEKNKQTKKHFYTTMEGVQYQNTSYLVTLILVTHHGTTVTESTSVKALGHCPPDCGCCCCSVLFCECVTCIWVKGVWNCTVMHVFQPMSSHQPTPIFSVHRDKFVGRTVQRPCPNRLFCPVTL